MKLSSLRIACFSPTGTSKAVALGIARGFDPETMQVMDITAPEARAQPLWASTGEALLLAVPVYMGRVPALLEAWLGAMEIHDVPTICVVTYGNRAFENALLELTDMVKSRGGVPIAGAAFIGEHSFSNAETPVAQGRPDADDLRRAEAFGRRVAEKLSACGTLSRMAAVNVPGERPYGGVTQLWDVDFIAVNDRCRQCGLCAKACPVGAIDPANSAVIDHEKCVTCCACIKACPQNARTMKQGPVKDASLRLYSLHREREHPECYV